jgi:hypothetical protein
MNGCCHTGACWLVLARWHRAEKLLHPRTEASETRPSYERRPSRLALGPPVHAVPPVLEVPPVPPVMVANLACRQHGDHLASF